MKYKKFLYSVNDEKFYWKMLLPKKGLKFAKTKEDIELRIVCVNKEKTFTVIRI
ncbi:hypothetical protein [Clostridium cuniculi]|uniref:hypothetical protein n=1 Tax=Clostridium cuniculi TaxID=2548455 RepID=UPI00140FACD5|nr:hypothetical protein [Clostridium cuniculi]